MNPEKPTSETRVHHPYSPSSLQCREACPKFTQRGGPVHEMALTGTKQHDAVDSQIDDPELPDYRAMAVTECIILCEERIKAYPGGTVLREEYLPVDDETVTSRDGAKFKGSTAGYLDFGIVSADGKTAEILDWKFGAHRVSEAKDNLQGIAYALGILKRFPNLETIKVGFIMPHADFVSEHTFTRSQFPDLLLRVVTVVRRAEAATLAAGDFSLANANTSSCRFCAHIARCPAVAAKVISVGKKYSPLTVPEEITPSLLLDPAQVKLGLGLADIVQVWADAYRRQASAKSIDDPHFLPEGYKLVTTSKRSVVDAKKFGELAKDFLPPEHREKIEACYEIGIGKCEKIISTAAQRGQKEATVEEFRLAALAEGAVKEGEPFSFLRQSD